MFCRCGFSQLIGMLIFFPWDLYEFYHKCFARLSLNKVKILFHSFPFGFIILIDMSDDNLGVTMKDDG